MPDKTNKLNSAKNPQPAIHTQAELEAAQAQVAQLERDLAKTNDINATYHECEALLQVIRGAITTFQQNAATNQLLPAPSPATNAPAATNTAAAAQITPPALTPSTTNDADTSLSPQTNPPSDGVTNSVAPSAIPAPAPTSPSVPPQTTMPDSDARVEDHEHATFPLIGGPPGAQTELLQTSAEQVRRAFELNTLSQLSLYERMLDLLGDQNRKLGELDRKTSELGNQIKSLKNP